jgi:hypothetical protein
LVGFAGFTQMKLYAEKSFVFIISAVKIAAVECMLMLHIKKTIAYAFNITFIIKGADKTLSLFRIDILGKQNK